MLVSLNINISFNPFGLDHFHRQFRNDWARRVPISTPDRFPLMPGPSRVIYLARTHFICNFLYARYTHYVTDSSACRHPSCSTREHEYAKRRLLLSAIYKTCTCINVGKGRRRVDLLSGSLSRTITKRTKFRWIVVEAPPFQKASINRITSDSGPAAKL